MIISRLMLNMQVEVIYGEQERERELTIWSSNKKKQKERRGLRSS